MHITRRAVCFIFTICLICLGIGCGAKLSGVYYHEYPWLNSEIGRDELVFRSNGTVVVKGRYSILQGTYEVSGDTVTVHYRDDESPYTPYTKRYRIEGSDLIDIEKSSRRFKRQ